MYGHGKLKLPGHWETANKLFQRYLEILEMPLLASLGRSLGRVRVGGSMPGVSKSVVGSRHSGRSRCLSTATTLQVLNGNLLWKPPSFSWGNHTFVFRPVRLAFPEEIIGIFSPKYYWKRHFKTLLLGLFSPNFCRIQIQTSEILWQRGFKGKIWLPGGRWSRYQVRNFKS